MMPGMSTPGSECARLQTQSLSLICSQLEVVPFSEDGWPLCVLTPFSRDLHSAVEPRGVELLTNLVLVLLRSSTCGCTPTRCKPR